MLFQEYIIGELAMGGWGETRKKELGNPRGTIAWTLHINPNSKNPSEQSLVREQIIPARPWLRDATNVALSNLDLAKLAVAHVALAKFALANVAFANIALANLALASLALATLALANLALANVALANWALAN